MTPTRVIGEFEAYLPVPIVVDFTLLSVDLQIFQLEINGAQVQIQPIIDAPIPDEYGNLDSPRICRAIVRISKLIQTHLNDKISPDLASFLVPEEEKASFEPILVESVRRLVVGIALSTGQWNINMKRPVCKYRRIRKFISKDQNLGEYYGPDKGEDTLPSWVEKTLQSQPLEVQKGLTADA